METLPVLISIPHGGTEIPRELAGRIAVDRNEILEDVDTFSQEIFDIETLAREVVYTGIARTFVDMNRGEDQLPPQYPDGIVKSVTCRGKPVYLNGQEPDAVLVRQLIAAYHRPYHDRLRELVLSKGIELALDCHTMFAEAPANAPDSGPRPMICLSNADGESCKRQTVDKLAACLADAFTLDPAQVAINRPFKGGYITRTYGKRPLPWIQVELNRALYLVSPWYDADASIIDNGRLMELGDMFRTGLRLFFQTLS